MELSDIRTDARYAVSPQLTSDQYTDAKLDFNVNRWYRKVMGWIIPVQGEWEFEGDILYRDVEQGVTDYEIPSNLIRLYKAEVMFETGGEFVPLIPVNLDAAAWAEGNSTRDFDDTSKPTIAVFGDFIQIKPAGTTDVANGIKIWAQTDFVILDTNNDVPDLIEPVQRVLAYGAAYDYCVAEKMWDTAHEMRKLIYGDNSVPDDLGEKGMIESLYANRMGARRHRITTPVNAEQWK